MMKRSFHLEISAREKKAIRAVCASLLTALLSLLFAGDSVPITPPAPLSPWFQDVTRQVGLDFIQQAGPKKGCALPQLMGTGAALFDYDNDGRLDLYLLQDAGPHSGFSNRLYHQEADGHFRDVTAGSGLGIEDYCTAVAVGDVNNDGLPDVLVCSYRSVRLFLNLGHGKFREVTHEAGLDDSLWPAAAAFFDYDRDGKLDLVIANYINYSDKPAHGSVGSISCNPLSWAGNVTRLYHNLGPLPGGDKKSVHFADVSLSSGIGRSPGPSMAVEPLDFNGDGWPDILITQDTKPNRLWINQHDGTFQEEALKRGIAFNESGIAQANMGMGIGDLDGSGQPSVYVTHETDEGNTLWTPIGQGLFEDHTAAARLADVPRSTGFGVVMADFTNNGSPDIALVNGEVLPGRLPQTLDVTAVRPDWRSYAGRNQIFANDGHGRFQDISALNAPFCSTANVGRGLVCGDIFNDGSLALVSTSVAGPARIFRNIAPHRGHWLEVRAIDPRYGGRDAYGARVMIESGGRRQFAWINPAYSMMCSNDPRAHFGLGKSQRVEQLTVLWPDGKSERFPACNADQILTLRRGEGR